MYLMLEKTSGLSCCCISSAYSTEECRTVAWTLIKWGTAVFIVFIYFFHSCPFLSAMTPVGSGLTHGASFLPVPILCLSLLAWLLQIPQRGKIKALVSPFTSFSISPGNFCFHTVKQQQCGLTWPLVTDFFPLWSNSQSFDLVLGNCCSSTYPLVSSVLPSPHLISFKYYSPSRRPSATSRLWVSRVSCPAAPGSALAPPCSLFPPCLRSSSRENHMTIQTSSVKSVFSFPNSAAVWLCSILARLLVFFNIFFFI